MCNDLKVMCNLLACDCFNYCIVVNCGFRFGRSCVDNTFFLNEVIQGRLQEGKKTFCFFLDIKKAYDTVWRDGLWYRMRDMGIQGKLW